MTVWKTMFLFLWGFVVSMFSWICGALASPHQLRPPKMASSSPGLFTKNPGPPVDGRNPAPGGR